jgi:hypothetical protein
MSVSPRVLLSVDYEPWFALFRRYDRLTDSGQRRDIDGGFTQYALGPILDQLGNSKASIYLVGEIADWYPEIPEMIVSAGHEHGLHCQIKRPMKNENYIYKYMSSSSKNLKLYNFIVYMAPMFGIN